MVPRSSVANGCKSSFTVPPADTVGQYEGQLLTYPGDLRGQLQKQTILFLSHTIPFDLIPYEHPHGPLLTCDRESRSSSGPLLSPLMAGPGCGPLIRYRQCQAPPKKPPLRFYSTHSITFYTLPAIAMDILTGTRIRNGSCLFQAQNVLVVNWQPCGWLSLG